MSLPFRELANLVQTHAGEEQLDWQVLYEDYRNAGNLPAENLRGAAPGGEALNAFMHAYASRPDPVGLLGGIYIIEGTGQRIVPYPFLPASGASRGGTSAALKFIEYHGANDQAHMLRWLEAVKLVARVDEAPPRRSSESRRSSRHSICSSGVRQIGKTDHGQDRIAAPLPCAGSPHNPADPNPWQTLWLDGSVP